MNIKPHNTKQVKGRFVPPVGSDKIQKPSPGTTRKSKKSHYQPYRDRSKLKRGSALGQMDFSKLMNNFAKPSNKIPRFVDSNVFGINPDPKYQLMTQISNIAQGYIDSGSGVIDDTMQVALMNPSQLSLNIIGEPTKELGPVVQNLTARITSPAQIHADAVATNTYVNETVAQTTEMCTSALAKGIAVFSSLNAAVGGLNGARDLLEASLQDALDRQIAYLMSTIVGAIITAHSFTHPLFISIFEMTWTENRQWLPDHIKADLAEKYNDPGDGSCIPEWMKPLKVIPEYLDFIQKVFGGAINDIWKQCDQLVQTAYAAVDAWSKAVDAGVTVQVNFPQPPLHVPMMAISKQMEDVLNKIYVIKEMIRLKAKMILKKLKSLEAPELYINMPVEFELILWTLVEAEFIMNNLSIVLDKILEYFINLLVQEFAYYAEMIIDKIFEIWDKVTEIVPPLQDLVELAWAIPNQADACVNIALNIALPEIYAMVKPYIDLPFQCIQTISDACDMAQIMIATAPIP